MKAAGERPLCFLKILVAGKWNIGQGYRKIHGLEDKDYSEYAIAFYNAKARNGKEYLFLKK